MAFIDKKNDELGTGDDLDPVDEILKRINESAVELPETGEPAAPEETVQPDEDAADEENEEDQDGAGEKDEDDEDDDEEEIADENERCVRCGKRHRDTSIDEDYEFCAKCRAEMLAMPLKWQGFVAAVCAIIIAGAAFVFASFTAVIALPVMEAGTFESENRLNDALSSYNQAKTEADTLNTQFNMQNFFTAGTKTFVKELKTTAIAQDPITVGRTLSSTIKNDKDYKNIWLRTVKPYSEMYTKFTVTKTAYDQIIADYGQTDPKTMPYDEVIAKLEALKTGEKAAEVADYFIEFYKSYFTRLVEKGPETELIYMTQGQKLAPAAASWIFEYSIADCYLRMENFDEALKIVDNRIGQNLNDNDALSYKIMILLEKVDFDTAKAAVADFEKFNTDTEVTSDLKMQLYRGTVTKLADLERFDEAFIVCRDYASYGLDAATSDFLLFELYRKKAVLYISQNNIAQALSVSEEFGKDNTGSAKLYALNTSIYRLSGDVQKALSISEEGAAALKQLNEITVSQTTAESEKQDAAAKLQGSTEFYRQQAIVQLLNKDTKKAFETAQLAYDSSQNYQDTTLELVNTYALCASLASETQAFSSVVDMLNQYGYSLADNVTQIIAGTKTVQDVFVGGKGDVL